MTTPDETATELTAKALGEPPRRGRLAGRRILVGDGGSHIEGEGDPPRNGQALARLGAWQHAEGIYADIDPAVANRTVAAILTEVCTATAPWSAVPTHSPKARGALRALWLATRGTWLILPLDPSRTLTSFL